MPTDDLVEMKSDIKYIKMIVEDLKPLKSNYEMVKGGLYVLGLLGGLTLGGISYAAHALYNNVNNRIDQMQNHTK